MAEAQLQEQLAVNRQRADTTEKEQLLMAEAQLQDQPSISHAQAHVLSHAASYTMRFGRLVQ